MSPAPPAFCQQSAPDPEDLELAGQLGRALIRLVRAVKRAKALAATEGSRLDYSSIPLLAVLSEQGPMRSNVLAEAVFSDPSTVSRQVATLVDLGHVRRNPDPEDRRAHLLEVTEAGAEALAGHHRRRDEYLAYLMCHWSRSDRRAAADLVDRLARDVTDHLHEKTRTSGYLTDLSPTRSTEESA